MKKKIITILIIAAILIITLPFTLKIIEKANNDNIDYSCSTDEDCAIKETGCNICYGTKKGCVNKDSVAGLCLTIDLSGMHCMGVMSPPSSCECVDNVCTDVHELSK